MFTDMVTLIGVNSPSLQVLLFSKIMIMINAYNGKHCDEVSTLLLYIFVAGLARCGKSCRLRWLNYLRPNLKHGNYTREEEEIIIRLHQQFGNRYIYVCVKS